jgi:hypothetical protein
VGCSSVTPLNTDGGATGKAGHDGGTGGASGSAGAAGSPPIGYCDTNADCEFRDGCCSGTCAAKTDPSPAPMVCTTACTIGLGASTCGCMNHQCSNASSCVVPGIGLCQYCPDGYQTGPEGCQTCECKPGDAGTDTATSGDGSTGALPACTWPASVDSRDAGAGACRAARTLLSCSAPNGAGEECTSDDPTQCSGDNGMPGVTFTCHDVCGAHEYGAACGSIGPGPTSDPPAGCRAAEATPAGVVFYCCPCL